MAGQDIMVAPSSTSVQAPTTKLEAIVLTLIQHPFHQLRAASLAMLALRGCLRPSLNAPRQTVAECGGCEENQCHSCGKILRWNRLWLPQLFTQPNGSLLRCGVPHVKCGEPWQGTKHPLTNHSWKLRYPAMKRHRSAPHLRNTSCFMY